MVPKQWFRIFLFTCYLITFIASLSPSSHYFHLIIHFQFIIHMKKSPPFTLKNAFSHDRGEIEMVRWWNGGGEMEVVKWRWWNGGGEMEVVRWRWCGGDEMEIVRWWNESGEVKVMRCKWREFMWAERKVDLCKQVSWFDDSKARKWEIEGSAINKWCNAKQR